MVGAMVVLRPPTPCLGWSTCPDARATVGSQNAPPRHPPDPDLPDWQAVAGARLTETAHVGIGTRLWSSDDPAPLKSTDAEGPNNSDPLWALWKLSSPFKICLGTT